MKTLSQLFANRVSRDEEDEEEVKETETEV